MTDQHNDSIADVSVIRTAVTLLAEPGAVVEVRIPDAGRAGTVSGYFDDFEKLARHAATLNERHGTTYMTLQPINAALLARAANRSIERAKATTSDKDVLRYCWLFIDTDPLRPAGISATDAEHEAALTRTEEIAAFLAGLGFPEPIRADSGNGGHALFRIDLPNDPTSSDLLKRCLAALAFLFDDGIVTVDTTTSNPARLIKLYGTVAGKGDSIPERPHRLAQLLAVPDTIVAVPVEQLESLAAMAPPAATSGQRTGTTTAGDPAFDLDAWIARHGLPVVQTGPWQDGRKYILNPCVFNPDHTNRAAYIVRFGNGAIAAGCHHNGCQGKGWRDLRTLYEPEYAERGHASNDGTYRAEPSAHPPRPEPAAAWPDPPDAIVYRGLVGHIIEAIMPHTEADPLAVLLNVLTAFGNAVGDGPHTYVGATRHTARLFVGLVGKTSEGRKGDSWPAVNTVWECVAPDWTALIQGGLSSGEGLISAVRDPIYKDVPIREHKRIAGYEKEMVDAGVEDKRLLCIEPEFGRVLAVMTRQGNTLSHVVRSAWDTGNLRVMTKTALRATGAHVSLIGHITPEELRRELTDVSVANGFANRFLWAAVRRSKFLPNPEPFVGAVAADVAAEVARMFGKARGIGGMERDDEADDLWREVYPDLAGEREGLAGAILQRAPAQVLRLSLVYALMDGSAVITVEHLAAALELWGYLERSVTYIFGDATGDPIADTILAALRQNGELTRTQISDLFGRNVRAERIATGLQTLLRLGKAHTEQRQTAGRPVEVWYAV
jgi:hypothetical protein